MVGSGERGSIQRGEFASEIPVVARHGHHGCVVGAQYVRRRDEAEAIFAAERFQRRLEPGEQHAPAGHRGEEEAPAPLAPAAALLLVIGMMVLLGMFLESISVLIVVVPLLMLMRRLPRRAAPSIPRIGQRTTRSDLIWCKNCWAFLQRTAIVSCKLRAMKWARLRALSRCSKSIMP
mgnify:CR=1 FL=1